MPSAVIRQPFTAGINRVQSATGTTGNVTAASFTITFGANTTVGNTVIVTICSANNVSLKVTSGSAIFFTAANPIADDTTGSVLSFIFYGIVSSAATVITIANVAGVAVTMCGVAAEYTGNTLYSDSFPGVSTGINTNIATASVSNTNLNALYIASLGQRITSPTQNAAWLSGNVSPFSIVGQITTNVNTTNNDRGVGFYEAIVGTIAARTANATSGFPTNRYATMLLTLKEIPM